MPKKQELARSGGLGRATAPGFLGALMQLTSDAVLAFDGQCRILEANPQAEALTGLAASELVGLDIRDLLFDANSTSDGLAEGLPMPCDGSLVELSCRLAAGGAALVGVRADRVAAPGETYIAVMRPADVNLAAERENDRLLNELSLANRRLSGTLRIVLETIDAQNLDILFSEVLEQIQATLEASGVLIYVAEAEGFRLRGVTRSLATRKVAQFMAYGEGLETIVTRSGTALRLRLLPPSERSLRAGALQTRELLDEDTGDRRRIPARQTPPFASLICVPVWFGGHVISIMEVGWGQARPTRKDDARLLESVAQYLSVELAAALSAMRAERAQRLDAEAMRIHELIERDGGEVTEDLGAATAALCEELRVQVAPITVSGGQGRSVAILPEVGECILPSPLDELVAGQVDAHVAVVPIHRGSALATWLAENGCAATGALLDVGELWGHRMATLVLREADEEPLAEAELDFLRRVANDMRETAEAGERRSKDTRISQALQSGMRNELQKVEGISGHGLYSSATEAASVGGDFYDLIRLPNRRACVILGDVSGKGVEAASVSAAVKTALGAYAWEGQAPARMVRLLNDFLLGFSRLETFATLFVGMIDLAHGTLTYCSAGHPPAILLRAETGEMQTLDEQSAVVGAFKGLMYHDGHERLAAGDRLLLYTDGVTEARSPSGAFFGEQGLRDAVMDEAEGDFDGLLDRLLARLDAFTERSLEDDVAMVALRFDTIGPAPRKPRRS